MERERGKEREREREIESDAEFITCRTLSHRAHENIQSAYSADLFFPGGGRGGGGGTGEGRGERSKSQLNPLQTVLEAEVAAGRGDTHGNEGGGRLAPKVKWMVVQALVGFLKSQLYSSFVP